MNFRIISSIVMAFALFAAASTSEAAQFRTKKLRIISLVCVVSPYGRRAGQMTAFKLGFQNSGSLSIPAGKTVVLSGAPFGRLTYKLPNDLQPNDQFLVWDFPISQKPTSCAASLG